MYTLFFSFALSVNYLWSSIRIKRNKHKIYKYIIYICLCTLMKRIYDLKKLFDTMNIILARRAKVMRHNVKYSRGARVKQYPQTI